MSIPISHCLMKRALTEPPAFEALYSRLEHNKKGGSFSVWPCDKHDPPCVLSEAEIRALDDALFDRTMKPVSVPLVIAASASAASSELPLGADIQSTGKPIIRTRVKPR